MIFFCQHNIQFYLLFDLANSGYFNLFIKIPHLIISNYKRMNIISIFKQNKNYTKHFHYFKIYLHHVNSQKILP